MQRVEDARLLTGAGTFVDDVVRPGMFHACFVRSPFPGRGSRGGHRVRRCAAWSVGVFTAADLNPVSGAWHTP